MRKSWHYYINSGVCRGNEVTPDDVHYAVGSAVNVTTRLLGDDETEYLIYADNDDEKIGPCDRYLKIWE